MYSKPKTMPELASMYTKMYHDRVSGKYFGKCPFCHGDIASFSADKQTGTSAMPAAPAEIGTIFWNASEQSDRHLRSAEKTRCF